ncbi:MAG: lytic transglycosylase domain-containing protein, partial [Deltaproteobacteria bacterium]|nr:lytic transglycosylase domain-containing protein [Deltaproteobacteria bacterium]
MSDAFLNPKSILRASFNSLPRPSWGQLAIGLSLLALLSVRCQPVQAGQGGLISESGWSENLRPAKGRLSPVTFECLADSSQKFEVPLAVLLLIMETEAGSVGVVSQNTNGSRDLGPMQINSLWLEPLQQLGLEEADVRDNGCVNLAVGAWILRSHLRRSGSVTSAIKDYHSRTPAVG